MQACTFSYFCRNKKYHPARWWDFKAIISMLWCNRLENKRFIRISYTVGYMLLWEKRKRMKVNTIAMSELMKNSGYEIANDSRNEPYNHVRKMVLNKMRPGDAYMRQETGPTLFQTIAWHLFGAKPLSEAMLDYCRLDQWKQIPVKFELKLNSFHWRNETECRMQNGGHFVSALMCQYTIYL